MCCGQAGAGDIVTVRHQHVLFSTFSAHPRMTARRLLSFGLMIALAGCDSGVRGDAAAPGGDVAEADRYGGTLVIGATADIADISPLTWNFQNALYMQQFVLFMPLVAYDDEFTPVPRLARSWEINDDTTAITFRLRDDIFWHDGVQTTAYDVKFSYDLARDSRTGYTYSGLWELYGEAEAIDSFTFRAGLEPHADFLDVWRVFAPVPEHVLRGVPAAGLGRHPFATQEPLGNGPFRFVGRRPGQSWTFAANSDFPAELGGRPYADRLVYRVIPEPATLLTELETGGIDFYTGVPAEQVPAIENSGQARLLSYPDRLFEHIVWNHRRAPFNDLRVRRALTLAIDRQALVETVRGGYGSVANSTVAPVFPQHDPGAGSAMAFDPPHARALLAAAGYADGDGDGILENTAGEPLRFTIKVPLGYRERQDEAAMVQANLRQVRVDARIQSVEFNTLLAQASDPARRDFDAMILGWKPEFRIDDSELFACRKRNQPMAFSGYCNPETDALLDSVARATDPAQSQALWSRYQNQIARDQPFTLLFFADRLNAANARLHGAQPDARGDWVGIARWWIDPAARQR